MEKQSLHSGNPKVPIKSVEAFQFHEAKKRIASIPETMRQSLHSGYPKEKAISVNAKSFDKHEQVRR